MEESYWREGARGAQKTRGTFHIQIYHFLLLGPFCVLEGQQGKGLQASEPHQGCLSTNLELKSQVTLGPRPAQFERVQFSGIKLNSSSPQVSVFLRCTAWPPLKSIQS